MDSKYPPYASLKPTNDAVAPQSMATGTMGGKGANPLLQLTPWSVSRMPFLGQLRDRITSKLTSSLRALTSIAMTVTLEDDLSQTFQEALSLMPEGTVAAEIQCVDNDVVGMLSLDNALAFCLVGMMLGGREADAALSETVRPYTSIEQSLIERTLKCVLESLNAGLEFLDGPHFDFVQMADRPMNIVLDQPQHSALRLDFKIDALGGGGRVTIFLPHAILKSLKERHVQSQQRAYADPEWSQSLAQEFMQSSLYLDFVLEQSTLKLEQVMNWRVGTQLDLLATPDSQITVMCGSKPLFAASIGHRGQAVAACIEDILYPEGD